MSNGNEVMYRIIILTRTYDYKEGRTITTSHDSKRVYFDALRATEVAQMMNDAFAMAFATMEDAHIKPTNFIVRAKVVED